MSTYYIVFQNVWSPSLRWVAVSFKYFESQKYCAVEIAQEIRPCYLWQRSTSEKLVFDFYETYICHGDSFNYKMYLGIWLFLLGNNISQKNDLILCWKNMCWFNRTVQQHGAKNVLWSTISGQQIFFLNWLAENKNKVRNHDVNVSSQTFCRRNSWHSR